MVRSYLRTYLYVGREYLLSFAVAFLFFFFIFFLNQILVMAEEIFSKKVPFWDVLLLVIYSLPIVIAFSFPFGSLVGALMAVGRLSSDNELLAFGALGVPSRHLVAPLLIVGLLLFPRVLRHERLLPSPGEHPLRGDLPADPVLQSRRGAGVALDKEVREHDHHHG